MKRRTFVALIFAGGLVAMLAALMPNPQNPQAAPKSGLGIAHHAPRYILGRAPAGCIAEPVDCGLVVW